MDVFAVEMQGIFVGITMNAVMVLAAYFAASYRCDPGTILATARDATLAYVKCFTAGIFLGVLCVGLMPGVRSSVELALRRNHIHTVFPVAEALVLAGFCATLCIEEIMYSPQRGWPSRIDSAKTADLAVDTNANFLEDGGDADVENQTLEETFLVDEDVDANPEMAGVLSKRPRMVRRLMMLSVCMGAHSLLEGLTLGLQGNVALLAKLLAGVYLHEALMLLALGLSFGCCGLPVIIAVKMGLALAAMAPVGQVLGLMFGSDVSRWCRVGVQGLTTGTFLHILFVEILPAELGNLDNRLPKVTSLIAGFAFMAAISFTSNQALVYRVPP